MSELDPTDLARSLGEIPLFREIQRLLFSQGGPVNWEIAEQIAVAVAEAGGPGVPPNADDQTAYLEACRVAELQLTQRLGLDSPSSASSVSVITRKEWVNRNIVGFKPYMERYSAKLSFGAPNIGVDVPGLSMVMGALGPLLLGVQVGFLIGYLARRSLSHYDLLLPRPGAEQVTFVFPNILELERDLDFDPQQFQLWLALHEISHRMEFESIHWVHGHFVRLIESFIDSAEFDSDQIIQQMQGIGDPGRLDHLMRNPDEMLPLMFTDEQRKKILEIQAFMAVLEGYGEHAIESVGRDLLDQYDRMKEGLNRRRAEKSASERLMEGFFGLDLKREQYRAGERFVVEAAIANALDALWQGPENLPTIDELNKPSAWISRVLFS